MKCVIFCLLAVHIFQTIFAEHFDEDMIDLGDKYENQMLAILDTFSESINTESDTAGIVTGEYKYGYGCSGSSDKAMDRYYQHRMGRCHHCINEAYTDKNIKSAEDCCKEALLALQNDEKLMHAMAKECIAECSESTADCNAEIKNLDALELENVEKNQDTNETEETQKI